jgi:hypothetical protein
MHQTSYLHSNLIKLKQACSGLLIRLIDKPSNTVKWIFESFINGQVAIYFEICIQLNSKTLNHNNPNQIRGANMNSIVRIVEWNSADGAKTLMFYNGYKFNLYCKNKDGTVRWRCETCKSVTITTKSTTIVSMNDETHTIKCVKMLPVEAECMIKYEDLKHMAKS